MSQIHPKVAVVGSLNMDYIASVARLPADGETVAATKLIRRFGGKGANQAIAAARQGARVFMLGCVGADDEGRAYQERLKFEGIDARGVCTTGKALTGTALIAVDQRAENMIIVAAGANGELRPENIRAGRKLVAGAKILLLQQEVPMEAVIAAVRIANRAAVPVIFNPSPLVFGFPWGDCQVDTVIANTGEARSIFGLRVEDISNALARWRRALVKRKIGRLIITRGAASTVYLDPAEYGEVSTLRVKPKDTVGAGDAFAGVLAARRAEGMDMLTAIQHANCAGALTTLLPGAQEAIPNRSETEQAFRQLGVRMRQIVRKAGIATALAFLAIQVAADPIDRSIPHPLPSHPGNIFMAGETVVVAEPPGETDAWRAVDYEGKLVKTGHFTNGVADLGPLPVGWYKIVRGGAGHWTNRVSAAVLEPLRAPTPASSPIGIDVAMAWTFPDARMADVINLCQLAGMNRVRDRVSWPEIEPQRGEFAAHTRYDDSVRTQTAAGLQVLDVNHISPGWANTNSTHFPPDLRDVYNTYRELAQRWQGEIEAFEPWNEADIKEFGGHMGSEMATLQKAAWLGLKAGNPKLTVCENVFAIHRLATLHDFQDNEAWPYFDTFNLHHYDPFRDYPRLFREFRSVSGGKPMWVTECSVIVPWKDENTKEPSEADLRVQSERVTMIYSMDIYEGAQAVFYFMLPHYVEYQRQYGVLRPDLTPRPAFLAVAAAGRLLTDARPLGRVQSTNQEMHGYLFSAKPDGRQTDVLVIWSDTNATFALPKPPAACFDHLGRTRPVASNVLKIGRAPLYVELAAGTRPALNAPPKPAKLLTGYAGPVVLQALLPEKDIVLNESACQLPEGRSMIIPIVAYNFGTKTVRGKLKVKTPDHWAAEMAPEVEIEPGDRKEVRLLLTHPETSGMTNAASIRITGRFDNGGGDPVLSFRLTSAKK